MKKVQKSLFEIEELFSRDKIKSMTNESWVDFMYPILNSSYMESIALKLHKMEKVNHRYFPLKSNIFRAFKLVNYTDLKAIVIGQDPYHGYNQATGLAFAIPNDQKKVPPSLRIIKNKIGGVVDNNLEHIAKQGVLFLNTALTVADGVPGSHLSLWKPVIDLILKGLSNHPNQIEWLLWGMKAQKYNSYIKEKDIVHQTYHPAAEARGVAKFEPNFENTKIQWTKITKLKNQTSS